MTEFDATVIETEEKDGKTHILLDRTAFYPGGGGQPCDTGFLNGHPVEAAYEKNGDIFHVVDGVFSDAEIHGSIDWARRFELIPAIRGKLHETEISLSNITKAIESGEVPQTLVKRMLELEKEKKSLEKDLKREEKKITRWTRNWLYTGWSSSKMGILRMKNLSSL